MRLNLRHIIELRRTLPTVYFQIGGRVIFSFFVETQKFYLGPELEESKRKRGNPPRPGRSSGAGGWTNLPRNSPAFFDFPILYKLIAGKLLAPKNL